MSEKLCVFCKKCDMGYNEGFSYSEYTWESGGQYINCKPCGEKEYYDVSDYRDLILRAKNCPHYEPTT